MKKILKGGTVINADGRQLADVLINGEIIEKVAANISDPDAQIIDVSGKLLFPGFIDAHTHFDLDVCNTTTADDFYTGGRSALRGGTTMVIDFACPNKGESLQYGLDLWHKKADGKTACDYGFHMTIDDWNDDIIAELPKMFEQGVSSFKMYMTYPAMMIGDQAMFLALRKMRELGGIAGVHCENAGVIDALIAEKKANGETDPDAHPKCRPSVLEAEAVSRLLKMAKLADVPVVIVHLSSEAGLREVEAARARGQKVYVETCPHYLLMDDSLYSKPDFEGAKYVCAPPLRKKLDNEVLWQALADGEIQTVSTDHCSFTLKQKDAGTATLQKFPAVCPALKHAAFCSIPMVSPKAESLPSAWSKCFPKRPQSSMALSPERVILPKAQMQTLLFMIRTARASLPLPIKSQMWIMLLMREQKLQAISHRFGCAASFLWRKERSWQIAAAFTSREKNPACKRQTAARISPCRPNCR